MRRLRASRPNGIARLAHARTDGFRIGYAFGLCHACAKNGAKIEVPDDDGRGGVIGFFYAFNGIFSSLFVRLCFRL